MLCFIAIMLLMLGGHVYGYQNLIGRKRLLALRGGLDVGRNGRGGGVEEADLTQFIMTYSQQDTPPKTANQLYDPEHLHRNGWRTMKGTLFQSSYLLKLMGWIFLTATLSGVVGWNFSNVHDMSYFEHLEDALHALITFLLGLFLSTVYGRWSGLFAGPYGALWGSINGISFYGNQYLKGPNKSKILLQNLRWGLLSHALVFKDGSGAAGSGLTDLLTRKLCTPEEAALMEKIEQRCPGASRAKIPWSWISESFTRAHEQGYLEDGEMTLTVLHAKCTDATGGIGAIMGQLGQKLPLPYVHLLTIMAKFNMALMAVTRGMAIASHVKYGLMSNAISNLHGILFLVVDMSRLIFLPLVYQGCFELHSLMWNPFDRRKPNNPVAFPELFYHWKILGESAALMATHKHEFPGVQETAQ